MKFVYLSIKYRINILRKKNINFISNRLYLLQSHFFYCVGIVSVTPASRYVTSASRYQSRSSMYIRGLIPRNSTEKDEAVSIGILSTHSLDCLTVQGK